MYIKIAHSSGISRPKKLCGYLVHPSGPAAANRSTNPHHRSRSVPTPIRPTAQNPAWSVHSGASVCLFRNLAALSSAQNRRRNIRGGILFPSSCTQPLIWLFLSAEYLCLRSSTCCIACANLHGHLSMPQLGQAEKSSACVCGSPARCFTSIVVAAPSTCSAQLRGGSCSVLHARSTT